MFAGVRSNQVSTKYKEPNKSEMRNLKYETNSKLEVLNSLLQHSITIVINVS